MTALYNRYGKPPEAVEFLDSGAVDAALNSGNWVLTQGEVTGGTPPAPPALPTEGSPGVPVGDQFTIAGLDSSTDSANDTDWIPFLSGVSGQEKRMTRAQLLEGVSATTIAWTSVTGKPSEFPPSAHGHNWSEIDGKPTTYPAAWGGLADIPDNISDIAAISGTGYLKLTVSGWALDAGTGGGGSVDWNAVPEAISSTVSTTGGAGPSDTVPLQQWKSADGLYGFGFRWRTDGRVDLFHKWNGVEYTPISMPARANLGGGASTAEFILGGPQITGTPSQRGLLSIAWGTYTRFARLLNPDGFDASALRLVFNGPSGEAANLRQFQPANSYHGWFASNTYGASSVPTFAIQHGANAVNGLQVTSGDSGSAPLLEARGADTDIPVRAKPKGASAFEVQAAAGASAKIAAVGPGANHDVEFIPKGTGGAKFPAKVGFGVAPISPQTLTGDLQGSAGAKAIAVALAALGFATDSTTLGTVPGAWLSGSGAPGAGVGSDGQMYLDRDSGFAYGPKAAGAWPLDYSDLNGPQGVAGAGYAADANIPYLTEWTRADQVRIVPSNATTYSQSAAAGGLTLTQTGGGTFMVGPSLPIKKTNGHAIIVEGTITASLSSGGGICIGTQGLTWGTLDTSNSFFLAWRSNSSLTAYKSDNTVDSSITITPSSVTGGSFVAGDVLKMVLRFDAGSGSPTLTLFKNGVSLNQTFVISGWREGNIWCGFRGNAASQAGILSRFEVKRLADPQLVYCDPAAASPGKGTKAAPFPTLEAAQLETAAMGVEDLRLYLAAGNYRGRGVSQTGSLRYLEVNGPVGQAAKIYGSVAVSSGWTSVGGGVWSRPFTYNDLPEQTGGGVIDPNRASNDGRQTFTTYTRAAPNTAPGSLTAGQYSVSITGADTLYLYPLDGVDPNTRTYELAYRPNCIRVGGATGPIWTYVVLRNLDLWFSYASGVELEKVMFEIHDVKSNGSAQTSGFQFIESAGQVHRPVAYGNYNDGLASVAGSGGITSNLTIEVFDPIATAQVVGDGISAHDGGPSFRVHGGYLADNGKHGVVDTGGGIECEGTLAENNADTNFTLALNPAVGTTYRGCYRNCTSKGGVRGFGIVTSATASAGNLRMELQGSIAYGASGSDLYLANANGAPRKLEVTVDATGFRCGTVVNNNGTIESTALTQPAAA